MIEQQLQVSCTTEANRHPDIFEAAAQARPDAKDILSFGCSTGQEVDTLSRVFPNARVVETEINPHALYRARVDFPQYEFFSPSDMTGKTFDVVFAMSVLCRFPESEDFLPFDAFKSACDGIDALIRPGGLFVVFNATYDVREALPHYTGTGPVLRSGFNIPRHPSGEPMSRLPIALFAKPA